MPVFVFYIDPDADAEDTEPREVAIQGPTRDEAAVKLAGSYPNSIIIAERVLPDPEPDEDDEDDEDTTDTTEE